MRLPTDATLLIDAGADPQLEQVWREERLPILSLAVGLGRLEEDLESIGTATVLTCGRSGAKAAAVTAALGFRTFLIGESQAPDGVQLIALSEALDAGRAARARERWKAARSLSRS